MIKYDNKEQFIVEKGYLNRTRYYLYPAIVLMKSYRPALTNLKDNFLCCSYKNEKIVLYYDRKNTIAIHELIKTLKQNNEYIDDYMHNENVYAVEVRPELNYAAFEEGRYSDIYLEDQINLAFSTSGKTKKVLTRDPEYKQVYVDLLNEWFNTRHSIETLESRPNGISVPISQYDIPPCMNQEILNYEKTNILGRGYIEKKPRRDN